MALVLWVGIVVHDDADIVVSRHVGIDLAQERQKLSRTMALEAVPDDLTDGRIERSEERKGSMPRVTVAAPLDLAGRIGRQGRVWFSAWIWFFSSTHRTSARSGRAR